MIIRTLLRRIAATIREWLFGTVPQPGKISIRMVREIMAFEFALTIAEGDRTDVASGTAVVNTTVAGEPRQVTLQLDPEALEVFPLYGSDNTQVDGEITWTDDAGNVGPARTFVFTLTDTIPPAQPGDIGIEIRREIPDDQVPPAEPPIL